MQLDSDKTLALLTTQVKEKFAALEKNTSGTKAENDTRELEKTTGKLEDKFSNEIETLKRKVEMLDQLKVIQQLQDISALQMKVDKIDSQTHSFAVNQQARNQDFLALYNLTIANGNSLKAHEIYQHNILKNMNNINNTFFNSSSTINAEIDRLEQSINMTNSRFDKASESGKFTCKAPGFYQISVTILSHSASQRFGIYMNGHLVSKAYISSTSNHESGTAVAAVVLQKNDEISIRSVDSSIFVDYFASCITIVKIM
ncbi:unnamed protein product [Mytilus edulis]|uniref:C1q domain-containing protein n=1 Tax=Mytilus edulis TaxID=6550 RepID=A0A8S3UIV0_MYTED|nr:unnamed protein product [Mytilus edulis]